MAGSNIPRRTSQKAKASGSGTITQVAGDQHVYIQPEQIPAPQATASLPAGPGVLVGRDNLVSELLALLSPGSGRTQPMVIAVAGLAGIGKTAVVLHAAAHAQLVAEWFTGGVLFADLRGYDTDGQLTADQVLGAWIRALGVRDADVPATPDELAALYRSLLYGLADDGRRVLLVADNAAGADQVRPLIPARSEHRLLVTSRETLESLKARLIDVDQLDPGPAAEMITGIVSRARPDDRRPQTEHEALARLAEACGGLPLALEIVAEVLAGDPGMRIADLVEDLADERTRLASTGGLTTNSTEGLATSPTEGLSTSPTEGLGTSPTEGLGTSPTEGLGTSATEHSLSGRLAPVRAAFDVSYRRLDAAPARLFRLLSVNAGPDIATEAAASLASRPPRQARALLAALGRAGLVKEQPVGGDRWHMHDLIRDYAADLARRDEGERRAALDRLLKHYIAVAQAADTQLRALSAQPVAGRFRDQGDALAWLDHERVNLLAAVTLAATNGREREAMSLAFLLATYLHWRRRIDDQIAVMQTALGAARQVRDRRAEAAILNNLGVALGQARRFDEAITVCEQGITRIGEFSDRHEEARALANLGGVLGQARRFDEAIDTCGQAAERCTELKDHRGEAAALGNLGMALREVRRFDEAISACERSADLHAKLHDDRGQAGALGNLGMALREVGRFDEAFTAHSRAGAISASLGDHYSEAEQLGNLGLALRRLRRFDEAITAHRQAGAIFDNLGDRHSEALELSNLGLALREVHQFDEAITVCQRAADRFREIDDDHGRAGALGNLGGVLQAMRRFDAAATAHQQAAALFADLGDRHSEAKELGNLGQALREVGRFDQAITAFRQAALRYATLHDEHGEAVAQANLRDLVTQQEEGRRRTRRRSFVRRFDRKRSPATDPPP